MKAFVNNSKNIKTLNHRKKRGPRGVKVDTVETVYCVAFMAKSRTLLFSGLDGT